MVYHWVPVLVVRTLPGAVQEHLFILKSLRVCAEPHVVCFQCARKVLQGLGFVEQI
jgi:hypothetical protein